MKTLSKFSEYGLRALLYMAGKQGGQEYVNLREMSENLDISFHFLTKILQNLTQAKLLTSYRGPNGGVAFKVPPDQISLLEVILVLEGNDYFDKCMLGLPGCGEQKPCPMHDFRLQMRTEIREEFRSTTVAEMGQNLARRRLRLSP